MAAVLNMLKKETIVALTFFMLSVIRWKSAFVLSNIAFNKQIQTQVGKKWGPNGHRLASET